MARFRFSRQYGQTGQTSHINWSDRSRQVCQIGNWTAPLHRSRRDDRNAYIERPIWSLDEGDMTSGRSAPRVDRSDRFVGAVIPVSFRRKLYFGMGSARVSTLFGARPPHPISIKGHGRLRSSNRSKNTTIHYFSIFLLPLCYLQTLALPISYLLFFLRFHDV